MAAPATSAGFASRLSLAPMVDVTDRYFRRLVHRANPDLVLYTPMVVDHAILRKSRIYQTDLWDPRVRHSGVRPETWLQLGGHDPDIMVQAAQLVEATGHYAGININMGCPAKKATAQRFGAQLMLQRPKCFELMRAVREAVRLPVSVKCRIGVVENMNDYVAAVAPGAADRIYEDLHEFIRLSHEVGGIERFVVHARHAVLDLNTNANREVPALMPDLVHALKRDFPHLWIEINGGVASLPEAAHHLQRGLDGVMVGRMLQNPLAALRLRPDLYTLPGGAGLSGLDDWYVGETGDEGPAAEGISFEQEFELRQQILQEYIRVDLPQLLMPPASPPPAYLETYDRLARGWSWPRDPDLTADITPSRWMMPIMNPLARAWTGLPTSVMPKAVAHKWQSMIFLFTERHIRSTSASTEDPGFLGPEQRKERCHEALRQLDWMVTEFVQVRQQMLLRNELEPPKPQRNWKHPDSVPRRFVFDSQHVQPNPRPDYEQLYMDRIRNRETPPTNYSLGDL